MLTILINKNTESVFYFTQFKKVCTKLRLDYSKVAYRLNKYGRFENENWIIERKKYEK